MLPDQEDLLPTLSFSISNAVGVKIFAARFLQPDPVKRAEKPTTSVVVAVAPADVPKFGNSISLLSLPPGQESPFLFQIFPVPQL